MTSTVTLGTYLCTRLKEAGVKHVFAVVGDYTLPLLHQMSKESGISIINVCNELNGGYAADGYARTGRLAVLIVAYMVGSLGALNAIAGAQAEDSSVLVICCGPNLHDHMSHHKMHHTTGTNFPNQSAECYDPIVSKVYVVRHIDGAAVSIDDSIRHCVSNRKPVYLELACNIANANVPEPNPIVFNTFIPTDQLSLKECLDDAVICIGQSIKPVILGGYKMRNDVPEFINFCERLGCAVAIQPSTKGLFDEEHSQYIGSYWGGISSVGCKEIVESADLVICIGAQFTDTLTIGWTTLKKPHESIRVDSDSITICGRVYTGIRLCDFLAGISPHVQKKTESLSAFKRYSFHTHPAQAPAVGPVLTRRDVRDQVQGLLDPNCSVVVDTGDSWFIGEELKLPFGAAYHVQMLYGSIGWSVGAALGVALASNRRVITLVGDGAFQMTAQEVSTMVKNNLDVVIFLMNNGSYGIEATLHDGPYNVLQSWSYAKLMKIFAKTNPNAQGFRAKTHDELLTAMDYAKNNKGPMLIECCIQLDDCSHKLLSWGALMARADMGTVAM